MPVTLIILNRMNWEVFSRLSVAPQQRDWIPEPLFCIAESAFESCWRVGIMNDTIPVGLAIVLNPASAEPWISRLMIDAQFQQQGIGTAALMHMMNNLLTTATTIRTSVHHQNHAGKHLFEQAGFLFSQIPGDSEEIGIFRR